ncbi:MAG: hypothetical protein AB1492_04265 [Bacillota bacterium]
MANLEAKKLCLGLIAADSEDEVVGLLEDAGYWCSSDAWQDYGGFENNYSTIGNQQSSPEAALAEKIVNAIDARLMGECVAHGVNPEGPEAPQTTKDAIERFFGEVVGADRREDIRGWSQPKRIAEARLITVAITGKTGETDPCYTISDHGEGQTPGRFVDTFLSLNKSNKLRIPFVQGKFNMGGTGVFKFGGTRKLQLIVSRRNPQLVCTTAPTNHHWGFTIVRREDPADGRRSSVFRYLAPEQKILSFESTELPIFPDGNRPYARGASWGSLIKLYEYTIPGCRGHALWNILRRLDLLLPDLALPVRIHECRPFRGRPSSSFETTLAGISVRLEDDRGDSMEEGFPNSFQIAAGGETMTATVFAFKRGKAETYRAKEGVLFVVNGQTHAHLTTDFFRREMVRLGYVADSLLVLVDCNRLSGRAREDLFMNSRDRLSSGPLKQLIERSLEQALREHPALRALSERRRREETLDRVSDSKPLEAALRDLLTKSPWLADLFLEGSRATNPFKPTSVAPTNRPFIGRRFPSYFRFADRPYGHTLAREAQIGHRCRITFATDASNDYFSRRTDRGEFSFSLGSQGQIQHEAEHVLLLHDGTASLLFDLPSDVHQGDRLTYVAQVMDPVQVSPFVNRMEITVVKGNLPAEGGHGTKPPATSESGRGGRHGGTSGIEFPPVTEVRQEQWRIQNPPFDKFSALRIRQNGKDVSAGILAYDFMVNVDNIYLQRELKTSASAPELMKARFVYGLVLLGIAALSDRLRPKGEQHDEVAATSDNGAPPLEAYIESMTRALAPVVLPMISALGRFTQEELGSFRVSGEVV